jgi:hypothetical protein
VAAVASLIFKEIHMAGKRELPQCSAITTKGKYAKRAVRDGRCEVRHPALSAAWHDPQRNTLFRLCMQMARRCKNLDQLHDYTRAYNSQLPADDGLPAIVHMDMLDADKLLPAVTQAS